MKINVQEYNSKEQKGKSLLSNRFIQAFQPELFEKMGFPTRINEDNNVAMFIDSMHDGRLDLYCKRYFPNGFLKEEYEEIKDITIKALEMARNYGYEFVIKAPIIMTAFTMRQLNRLVDKDDNHKPAIFEIGGGSGWLGVFSNGGRYPYISTDITQAFYICQNHVWEHFNEGCVIEYLDGLKNIENNVQVGKMLHIPYWKLWELRNSDLRADIIVSNHNVCEMHERALDFYLTYAKHLLRDSKYKLFVCESLGWDILRSVPSILNKFIKFGFELVYQRGPIYIFYFNQSGDEKETNRIEKKISNNFNEAIDIMRSRKADMVPIEELKEFYKSISGQYDTPDEEFVHYIGHEWI